MKMRHHIISIGHLPVDRHDRESDAAQSADRELDKKADGEEHGRREPDRAAPHRRAPVENFYARRHGDHHAGGGEK